MGRKADMLVMDIDGTLVDADMNVGEADIRAIDAFMQDGGVVYLASGRKYRAVRQFADDNLPSGVRAIASNGSVCELSSRVAVERISSQALEAIFVRAEALDASLFLFGLERTYYSRDLPSYFVEEDRARLIAGRESALVRIADRADVRRYADDIVNGIVIEEGRPELLVAVRTALSDIEGITVSSSAPNNVEIFASGASKSAAIRRACGDCGIDLNRVMAFGDGMNDIDMLELVGRGVAMGNAPDEVKRRARYVTKPNTECGIAWFLGDEQ